MTRSDRPTFPDISTALFDTEIEPAPAPLGPIVDEVLALIELVPMERRVCTNRDGSWSAIDVAFPNPNDPMRAMPTEWLDHLPALKPLVEAFGGEIAQCSIGRIAPGDLLDWHHDPASVDHELSRLHLPIITNPKAVTDFCDARVHWPAGRLFYGDYGFPHRVLNTGTQERIHLYFDVPSESVRPLVPEAFRNRFGARENAVNALLAWKASSAA